MRKTLYIFIDESGDLNFTKKSSSRFYLGGLVVDNISSEILSNLYNIKHECLVDEKIYSKSRDIEYFHATNDLQFVRDKIFKLFDDSDSKEFNFYGVYTEKNKANPIFYKHSEKYYGKHCVWLINAILYDVEVEKYENIMIFFDGMPVSKNKKAMFKGLKSQIKEFFIDKKIKIPYFIYSHQSKSHKYLQISDYINWSINVKHERGEDRPYNSIKKFIRNEFDPFSKSTKKYY